MTEGMVVTYAIDPEGLSDEQMNELSSRMITELKKRVDPRGKLPLQWRPSGYMGIEVHMPLPRPEVRQKRQAYEATLAELRALNVSSAQLARTFPYPLAGKELQQDAMKELLGQLQSGLTRRQVESILEMSSRSERANRIAQLENDYPGRAQLIDKVAAAFDAYRPLRGPLDDPQGNIDRLLQGLGVLEFRVPPVWDDSQEQRAEIERCLATLAEKGPQRSRADKYVWCGIGRDLEEQRSSGILSRGPGSGSPHSNREKRPYP